MVEYAPDGIVQNVLTSTSRWPGYLGRTSRRKLRRRYGRRAIRDFNQVLNRLGPQDVVLDLGANYGDYTEILSRTGAAVHAYEPDPETFSALSDRFENAENVTLHEKAIADRSGELKLRRMKGYARNPRKKSLGSSIVHDGVDMSDENSVSVPVASFFDVLKEFSQPVTLIKMDIEGAEWGILSSIFERSEPFGFDHMFVETHEFLDWSKQPLVEEYRAKAASSKHSTINLYWP